VLADPLREVVTDEVQALTNLVATDDTDDEGVGRDVHGTENGGATLGLVTWVERVVIDAQTDDWGETTVTAAVEFLGGELGPGDGGVEVVTFAAHLVAGVDSQPAHEDGEWLDPGVVDGLHVTLHVPGVGEKDNHVGAEAFDEARETADAEHVTATVHEVGSRVDGVRIGVGIAEFVDTENGYLVPGCVEGVAGSASATGEPCRNGRTVTTPKDLHVLVQSSTGEAGESL
jgi:hypothetical protein